MSSVSGHRPLGRVCFAVIVSWSVLSPCQFAAADATGYVAYLFDDGFDGIGPFEPRIVRWQYDSTLNQYSVTGDELSAAPNGSRINALEVNPNTGEVYYQHTTPGAVGTDQLHRYSWDNGTWNSLGVVGNGGARGFTFNLNDNSVYALNDNGSTGSGSLPCGSCQLVKFPQDITQGGQYAIGVDGNDLVADGSNIYVAANDAGGRIIHNVDTGASFTPGPGNGFVPFDGASQIELNPAFPGRYSAVAGYEESTFPPASDPPLPPQNQIPGTKWIITGDVSGFSDGDFGPPGASSNVGTGAEFANDMGIGPDGTIFFTQRDGANHLQAWNDCVATLTCNGAGGNIGGNGADTPLQLANPSNSDDRGSWLAVEPTMTQSGTTIVHTAAMEIINAGQANEENRRVLRAFEWDPTLETLTFLTQFSLIPQGAWELTEIAIDVSSPSTGIPGDFDGDDDVDGIDFLVWQDTDGTPASLNDWQMGYGTVALTAASTIPEPASLSLIAAAWCLATFRRRC